MEPAQQRAREAPAADNGRGEPESSSPGRRSQAAPGAENGVEPSGGGGRLDGKGAGGPRRRRGGAGGFAPPAALAAGGTSAASGGAGNANSLLLRRGRLKRNLSAAVSSPAAAAPAASLGTRSLDRKALLLKPPRQLQPLQPPERDWVRRDLQRGCVHIYERHMNCYLRPVLCTLETTAAEVAARLQQLGHRGGSSVVRVLGKAGATPQPPPEPAAAPAEAPPEPAAEGQRPQSEERPRSRRGTRSGLAGGDCGEAARPGRLPLGGSAEESDLAVGRPSPAPSDFSPGPPPAELYLAGPPLSCPSLLGELGPAGSDTESFSPSAESVSDRLDPYSSGGGGSSSSEELEVEPVPPDGVEAGAGPGRGPPCPGELPPGRAGGAPAGAAGGREPPAGAASPGPPALYVQLHGETSRRLEAHEKPLQIQNDYLSQLGFRDLWRVQEEGMDSETGCLIRFYAGERVGRRLGETTLGAAGAALSPPRPMLRRAVWAQPLCRGCRLSRGRRWPAGVAAPGRGRAGRSPAAAGKPGC